MKILSSIDISHMIAETRLKNENLNVCAGKGDSEKVVVKKGLKIRHKPTGLVYTLIKVLLSPDCSDAKVLCQRPGKKLLIHSDEFKDYERQ